jgi:hypothetical protein
MKGVNYITDSQNRKVAVQIDLKLLEKYDEEIEDLIDEMVLLQNPGRMKPKNHYRRL